jgi:hypothetical protein
MSRDTYAIFHSTKLKKAIDEDQEFTDAISLEPICDESKRYDKYHAISYLRKDKLNRPNKIYYWTLESAKLWVLDNNKKIDPETRLLINNGFPERIILQLELQNYPEYKNTPTTELLSQLFDRYIKNENITPSELCAIKVFLHMDDSGFLSDWLDTVGTDIRTMALTAIETAENESWLLRKSSIVDSDIIKARVITIKDTSGIICHIPIAHVYSFGYIELAVARSATMPNEKENNQFPNYVGKVYPSFIDILEAMATKYKFNVSKIIHNIVEELS